MLTLNLATEDGIQWRVTDDEGWVIVPSSVVPEDTACRVLVGEGWYGPVRFRHSHGTIGIVITDAYLYTTRKERARARAEAKRRAAA